MLRRSALALWSALGIYGRLDRLGTGVKVEDPYGAVWIRLLLGMGL